MCDLGYIPRNPTGLDIPAVRLLACERHVVIYIGAVHVATLLDSMLCDGPSREDRGARRCVVPLRFAMPYRRPQPRAQFGCIGCASCCLLCQPTASRVRARDVHRNPSTPRRASLLRRRGRRGQRGRAPTSMHAAARSSGSSFLLVLRGPLEPDRLCPHTQARPRAQNRWKHTSSLGRARVCAPAGRGPRPHIPADWGGA